MKNVFKVTIISALLLLASSGCMKQKTTLHENTPSSQQEVKPLDNFAGVDTSDSASFREAKLTEAEREALQPVYFEYNSSTLTPEAIHRLEIVANFLKENPGIRILIEGNCDERGSSEYNMGLGNNRSTTVREYLVNYGLRAIRFETSSLGKERPAVPNCTEESCHAKNRRAEFKLLAR